MTEGYTWRQHMDKAVDYCNLAFKHGIHERELLDARDDLIHARQSITRALALLPKVKDEDDAA